jgi:hypothetical protein
MRTSMREIPNSPNKQTRLQSTELTKKYLTCLLVTGANIYLCKLSNNTMVCVAKSVY